MFRLESAGGIGGTVILGRDPWAGPAPMKMTGAPPPTALLPPPKTMMRGATRAGMPRRLSGDRAWCAVLLGAPVQAASRQAAASAAAQRTAAVRARVPGGQGRCSAAQRIGGLQQAGPQGGVQARQQPDRRA